MLHVRPKLHLRRFFGVLTFSIGVALFLSVPATAVYYNLGAFWKSTSTPPAPSVTERRITAGDTHGCAIISDGTAKCWGLNTNGQLGDGTTTQRTSPVTVSGLTGVVSINAGTSHSCATLSDGTARCWGYNSNGLLGDGTGIQRTSPVTVSGLTGAVSISPADSHTCALLSDGTAKCWGYNGYGQLGDGTTTTRYTPAVVSGLTGAVSISTGSARSCAVLSDGTVKCWGFNGNGELGDGTTTDRNTPTAVSGLTGAVSINEGSHHTCALLSDGTAKCWGINSYGQVGDGTTTNRASPVAVSGLSGAVSIDTGTNHACAVLSDGTAKCWGLNTDGQLGDGTTTDRSAPVAVSGLTGAVTIAAGNAQTCAAITDGTVKCWGKNLNGQLGNGTTTDSLTFVSVSGFSSGPFTGLLDKITSLSTANETGCAVLRDGTAKCWGYNYYGQLGDGTTLSRLYPVTVSGLTGAVSISAGFSSCALLSDGTAKCWGYNFDGEIGDGTTANRSTPVVVSGLSGAVSISTFGRHSCALLSDGTVKCWGYNSSGQLGDGTTTNRLTPVTVSGLSGAVSITTGQFHSCAVLSDGTAKCWGWNNFYGDLGDGTTTNRSTPVAVSGLTGAVSIAAGSSHTCASLSDGTARCWGYNINYGQLGDGTTTDQYTPVVVSGLSGAVSITAGRFHSCALLASGTTKCWGHNAYGQLADGTTTTRNTPVDVSGLSGAVSIGAGGDSGNSTCALLSDGTAKCWGANWQGELGNGMNTGGSTPVSVLNYFVGAATANNSGAITLVIPKPANTLTNHVMVAGVTTRPSTTTITTPSGWTLLQSQATGNVTQSTYYRVATSADSGVSNYTFTLSVSAKASGAIITYQNIDPAAPVLTSNGQATGASTTITAPTLSTTESDYLSIVFYGIESDDAITPSTYYGTVGEASSSGGSPTARTRTLATQSRWTSSPTGAITTTLGTARDNVGQHVLLKKAP